VAVVDNVELSTGTGGAALLGPAALAAPGDNAGYSGPYCTPFEHADMYHQLP